MSKILLVEDNPDAVKRIIRYINKIFAELDVVSFPEAGDALQYAKANDISLFILDIQLEDYKGTNLAKQLRELPEYKYTPIIFETALAGEELSAYRDVKCYSFLVKPFGEEEFVTAFRDALGLSKQMSQQAKTIQIEQKQFNDLRICPRFILQEHFCNPYRAVYVFHFRKFCPGYSLPGETAAGRSF